MEISLRTSLRGRAKLFLVVFREAADVLNHQNFTLHCGPSRHFHTLFQLSILHKSSYCHISLSATRGSYKICFGALRRAGRAMSSYGFMSARDSPFNQPKPVVHLDQKLLDAITEAADPYPIPPGKKYEYGTAGVRFPHSPWKCCH